MDSSHIPRTQRALTVKSVGRAHIQNVPVEQPGENEVLIKVEAIALNPSDVKHLDHLPKEGAVCGNDLAGYIVKVGNGVKKELRVGDRVSTFVFGCNPAWPENGAFAEYAVAQAEFCIKLSEMMSFVEGATLGVGLVTCGLAFRSLGLVVEKADEWAIISHASTRGPYVLICGGSTATGTLAIQLVRHLGYTPLATCSPHNNSLVRKAGAAATFDYKSPSCGSEIRNFTDGKLGYVLDCIGETSSATISYGAIGLQGGRYTSLAPFPERLRLRRKGVVPDWVLGYIVFRRTAQLDGEYAKDATPEDGVFMEAWLSKMQYLVTEGQLSPHPVQINPGGLRGIAEGSDMIRKGMVSGKKLVYILHDT